MVGYLILEVTEMKQKEITVLMVEPERQGDGSLVSRCNFRCAGNGVVRLLTLHKFEFRKVNLLPLCATPLKEVFRCKNRHYFYCSVLFCVLPVPVPSGTLITEAAATLT